MATPGPIGARLAATIIGTITLVLVVVAALLRVGAAPTSEAPSLAQGLGLLEAARVHQDDARFAAAEHVLREVVAADPTSADARVALATVAVSRHRLGEAIDLATAVLDADPTRADALAVRGDALLAIGRPAAAAADHGRLHQLLPGPESLVRLAHGLESSGHPHDALELVRRAVVELEGRESATGIPATGEAAAWFRWRLGDLERHLGHWDRAVSAFEAAAEIQPGYALAYEGLVDVALKTGELDRAATLLDDWRAALGPSPDELAARATLHDLRGDTVAADGLRDELVEVLRATDVGVARLDLAEALLDVGDRTGEPLRLTAAELERRRAPDVLAVHAAALLDAGLVDEARAAIDEALASGTDEPGLLLDAARISLAEGDLDRAALELRTALAVNAVFDPVDGPAAAGLLAEILAGAAPAT